jgi:hypothetical protein
MGSYEMPVASFQPLASRIEESLGQSHVTYIGAEHPLAFAELVLEHFNRILLVLVIVRPPGPGPDLNRTPFEASKPTHTHRR